MTSAKKQNAGTRADNRSASFNFELGDRFEAGMILTGSEVKSLRTHTLQIKSAYIIIDQSGRVWVRGLRIPRYKHSSDMTISETRERQLLLHTKEIAQLIHAEQEKLAIIPTKIYFKGNLLKLEIALGKKKKKHDKRQTIKSRDISRDIARNG